MDLENKVEGSYAKKAYQKGLSYLLTGILTIASQYAQISEARAETTKRPETNQLIRYAIGPYCYQLSGEKAKEFVQKHMQEGITDANRKVYTGLEKETKEKLNKCYDLQLKIAGFWEYNQLDKEHFYVEISSEKEDLHFKKLVKIEGEPSLTSRLTRLSEYCKRRIIEKSNGHKKTTQEQEPQTTQAEDQAQRPKSRRGFKRFLQRFVINSIGFQKEVYDQDQSRRYYSYTNRGSNGTSTGTIDGGQASN